MTAQLKACDTCGAEVVLCDNNVLLDHPAAAYDELRAGWTIMQLGTLQIASVGNPGIGDRGHALHEHQPPESVMA